MEKSSSLPSSSLFDRFLDGYQHAGDNHVSETAIQWGSTVEGLKSIVELQGRAARSGSAAVGAYSAYRVGWFGGGNFMARELIVGEVAATLLDGWALEGAAQVGKITAGLTNMFYDAY